MTCQLRVVDVTHPPGLGGAARRTVFGKLGMQKGEDGFACDGIGISKLRACEILG